MKIFKYIKSVWLCLLMGITTTIPTLADTNNAADYFKITHQYKAHDEPYIEFEYADWDPVGDDDALINPEFGIIDVHGNEICLAKMTRCHDEMTWHNTEYGLMQVVGQRQLGKDHDELRIVKMRYYPTEKAMSVWGRLYHKGFWDIDDDGGKGYYIYETRTLWWVDFDLNLNQEATLAFNGKNYVGSYLGINPQNFVYGSNFKPRVKITETKDFNATAIWDGPYDGFKSGSTLNVNLDHLTTFTWKKSLIYWFYITQDISVKNGSYGTQENKRMSMTQCFTVLEPVWGADPLREPSYYNDYSFQYDRSPLIYIESSSSDWYYDIYRREASQPESARTLVHTTSPNTYCEWIDTEANPYKNYIYDIVSIHRDWPYKSFQHALNGRCDYYRYYDKELLGEGTESSPYLIRNIDNYQTMLVNVNHGNRSTPQTYWKLQTDLDLTGIGGSKTHYYWRSIGNETHRFQGNFDGNGHEIKYNIQQVYENDAEALFGTVQNAVIKNLKVTGDIHAKNQFASGLASISHGVNIENCEVNTRIHSTVNGDGTHGGFVGVAHGPTFIRNSVNKGSISGTQTNACGGLVGYSHQDSNHMIIEKCLNFANYQIDSNNSDVMVRGKGAVKNSYYLYPLGQNSKGAGQLTDREKNVGLAESLGIGKYQYLPNDYPVLKTFSTHVESDGTKCDIIIDKTSNFITQQDIHHADVKMIKEINGNARCTATLPFDLSAAEAAEWGKFYVFSKYYPELNLVVLTEVTNGVSANTPYILDPANPSSYKIYRNITLPRNAGMPDAGSAPQTNGLTGTCKPVKVPSGAYGYSAGDDGVNSPGRFVHVVGNNVTLPAFCAYLWLDNVPASANTLNVQFEDGEGNVTGIGTLTRDKNREGIYTLDGRKLNAPQRGINIINGKKVLVK